MKVELKLIIDQLTEALGIKDDRKVAALFDDQNNNEFVGWCIVQYEEDGEIIPIPGTKCQTIKELFEKFYETIR